MALILDIDHQDGPELALELPAEIRPHLILDPWSGRSAGIFMLSMPVLLDEKFRKAQALTALVAGCLAQHFRADVLPVGSLTKNPYGRVGQLGGPQIRRTPEPTSPLWEGWQAAGSELVWHTIPGAAAVDLGHIRDHFRLLQEHDEQPKPARRPWRGVADQRGRNCELFDTLRHWCYDTVERRQDVIATKAAEINLVFLEPLPAGEVAGIARSVAKFMRTYTPGRRIDAGVMGLKGSPLTLKQKQKLSAMRTADLRAERTLARLQVIVRNWPKDKKITQKSVAEAAGMSVRSVKTYWSEVP